jgi:hypothetical protein
MPNDLTLRVGNDTATHTFPGTAAQVRASIVRICKSLGISTEGTPDEVGTRLLDHIVDDLQRRAEAASIAELEAAQRVANAAAAKAENPL